MNNEIETVRYVFKGKYYFSEDCLVDSLVRLEKRYNCYNCILADTIYTAKIRCSLMMKRETKILR